ncbi:hypothetical protein [Hamadaea tsunoensis]|uniref:hypothetical protein n=1 Tax=Hamadaea tsunoensis TaxID=53368 RepID=UPI0012F86202|nr:hypothetical protein [Hamadaea tsunoensis]
MLDIDECLRQMMSIQGALGAGLIDFPSGSTVGAAGRGPGGSDLDGGGAAQMVHAALQTAAFATVGRPERVEGVVITAGNGYHLLQTLDQGGSGRLVLYVWLDRMLGNLAVTQRHMGALADAISAN